MSVQMFHAWHLFSSRAEVFRARLVRVWGLLLQTFWRQKDMPLCSGDLQEPGSRPGVHHVKDRAELDGELSLHRYAKKNTCHILIALKHSILMNICRCDVGYSHQWHVDWYSGCAWILHLVQRAHGHLHILGPRDTKKPQWVQWGLCWDVAPGERQKKYTINWMYQALEIIPTLKCVFTQAGRWNNASCSELSTFICCMPKAHYRLPSVKPMVYGCPQVGKNIGDTLILTFTLTERL